MTEARASAETQIWHRDGTARPGPGRLADRAGETLAGRYRLEELLAVGGLGVIYRARDLAGATTARPVAVKLLRDGAYHDPAAAAALRREADITRALRHPNIVAIHAFGHDAARGEPFIAMEWLDGATLERRPGTADGAPLPPALAFRIVADVGRALAYAHGRTPGIVHGDLKPGNILLTRDGRVKLLDFGAARVLRPGDRPAPETAAYTLPYASGERIAGLPPEPADDVYALACLAYQLLAGRHPFGPEGERHGAAFAREAGLAPAPIPGLGGRQRRTLARGLAFARADRTATVAEFLAGLRPGAIQA